MKSIKFKTFVIITYLLVAIFSQSVSCPNPCDDEASPTSYSVGFELAALSLGSVYSDNSLGDVAVKEDDEDITLLSSGEDAVKLFISEDKFKKYASENLVSASREIVGGSLDMKYGDYIETPNIRIELLKAHRPVAENARAYLIRGFSAARGAVSDSVLPLSKTGKKSLAYDIFVIGGYKRSLDSSEYIPESDVGEDCIYYVEATRTFYLPQPREFKIAVWQKFKKAGVPADDIWNYNVNGKPAYCEKKVSLITVKNNRAPDTVFKKVRRVAFDGDMVRTHEVIRYRHYSKIIKKNNDMDFDFSKFRPANIVTEDKIQKIEKGGKLKDIKSRASIRHLKQGVGEAPYAGWTQAELGGDGKWKVYELDRDGKNRYGRIYTLPKGVAFGDSNKDGVLDSNDLAGLDVQAEIFSYSKSGKKASSRIVEGRLVSSGSGRPNSAGKRADDIEPSEGKSGKKNSFPDFETGGKLVGENEFVDVKTRFGKSKVVKLKKRGNANASSGMESSATASAAPAVSALSSDASSASLLSDDEPWLRYKEDFSSIESYTCAFNTNGFLDSSGNPDYSKTPSIQRGTGYGVVYSYSGYWGVGNMQNAIIPTGEELEYSPVFAVQNKTVLKAMVYDSNGNLVFSAEYLNTGDITSPNFSKLLSWRYYTYDAARNRTGEYLSNGTFTKYQYTYSGGDYFVRKTNSDGIVEVSAYEDSTRERLKYVRTVGVNNSVYGQFKDSIIMNSGSLSGFSSCSCASAISEEGDALVTYLKTNGIDTSDVSVGGNIIHQTYKQNNADGNLLVDVDSYGLKTEFQYSSGGDGTLVAVEIPAGYPSSGDGVYRKITYNSESKIVSVEGLGSVNEYRSYGSNTESTYYGISSAAEVVQGRRYISTSYDGENRKISEATPLGTTLYSYNFSGDLLTVTNPDGSVLKYVYNYANPESEVTRYLAETSASPLPSDTRAKSVSGSYYETLGSGDSETVWLVSKTSANGIDSYFKTQVTNLAQTEGDYVIIERSEYVSGSNKTVSEVLLNGASKLRIDRSRVYKDSAPVSTEEIVSLNGFEVEKRLKDASGALISSSVTNYDDNFRISSVEYYKGERSESLHLYTEKYFYYPAGATLVGSQSIVSQGRLKAVSIVKGALRLGRIAVYYGNGEKHAGMLKSMIYATEFSASDEPISGNAVHYEYNDMGKVAAVWGSGEIPSRFAYDKYGSMTDMYLFGKSSADISLWTADTWPSALTINDVSAKHTQWEYDADNGLLMKKTDALGKSQTANYSDGRLCSVNYPDGASAAYTYNSLGKISAVNDGDKSTSFSYDVLGRITNVSVAGLSAQNGRPNVDNAVYLNGYAADNSNFPTLEKLPDGYKLCRTINADGRITSVTLQDASEAVKYSAQYTYDTLGRVQSLTANGKTITYTYTPTGGIDKIFLNSLANISYVYDDVNRLENITYKVGNEVLRSNAYAYGANEKIASVESTKCGASAGVWQYAYNDVLFGLTGATLYKNSSAMPYSAYSYSFDSAGNPESVSQIGSRNFASNAANQTTQICKSADFARAYFGWAETSASLAYKIDGVSQQLLRGEGQSAYAFAVPDHSATPKYSEIQVQGQSGANKAMQRGKSYLEETPESLRYTDSGNLASDSRWLYTWSAGQRLVKMETSPQAVSAGAPKEKYEYAYDYLDRKTQSKKYVWTQTNGGEWTLYSTNRRYYDDHNLIYEKTTYSSYAIVSGQEASAPVENKFYYGADLLGLLYGTGGTGGLVMANINGTEAFVLSNQVGNVEALYGTSQDTATTLLAEYEYEPFGNIRKQSGMLAEQNPIKFSTRYHETAPNLYYYTYRHYSPKLMKWLSKDPLGEQGDRNLYRFCADEVISNIDMLGDSPHSTSRAVRFNKNFKHDSLTNNIQSLKRFGSSKLNSKSQCITGSRCF